MVLFVVVPLLSLYWALFANPPKLSNGRFLQTPKSVKSAVFSPFFTFAEQKQHRKYQCFWLRTNAKPRYLRGFEPLRAKITVFTVFCGPSLAKTLLFTQFPACWQKLFWMPKAQKHCKLHDFYAWTVPKNRKNDQKSTKKRPTKNLQNASSNFTLFFPTPNPQKRGKPQQAEGF